MHPPPSQNFTNQRYNGLWYEIGKMQTAGGAAFEKDCVCTTIDISPKAGATNGDSTAVNSCRRLSPDGNFLNATGIFFFFFFFSFSVHGNYVIYIA